MNYDNEKDLMESLEQEEWVSVKDKEGLTSTLKAAALQSTRKDQRMNIRIASRDLKSLKAKALEEGVPYQTLVSSVLHKYVAGSLVEKK